MNLERRIFERMPNNEANQYCIDVLAWFIGERYKNKTDDENKEMAEKVLRNEADHIEQILNMLNIHNVEDVKRLNPDKKIQFENMLSACIQRYLM